MDAYVDYFEDTYIGMGLFKNYSIFFTHKLVSRTPPPPRPIIAIIYYAILANMAGGQFLNMPASKKENGPGTEIKHNLRSVTTSGTNTTAS